jgi:hypothetical protein
MAQSLAHRFGQIIGDVLETAVVSPLLEKFAKEHGLYLDRKGPRPCRAGLKCKWIDLNGNSHDLDFVLERGGTPDKAGIPVAFIESAWRRYTKHSRNKVQEIQGAVEPLVETYHKIGPFKGAILAGVFTEGALTQLRSLGFRVLYFPYDAVVNAFKKVGVDCSSDERTPERSFQQKIEAFKRLTASQRKKLATALTESQAAMIDHFIAALSTVVSRQIDRIIVLALHGKSQEVITIADAINFIESYNDPGRAIRVERFEIQVRYNNGDIVSGSFKDKEGAVEFLRSYQPVENAIV